VGRVEPVVSLRRPEAADRAYRARGEGPVKVGIMLRYPNMTQAKYDAVEQELKRNDQPAAGEVLSIVGPLEGGWQVVDVWESQAVFETYMRDKVKPVLQRLGIQDPTVTAFPVHDMQVR
jgi:hypothetical protein